MGWKIPEIRIRVPEVRVPKVKAARAMPKPRAIKPASGKVRGFSLTVFSGGKASIESKHIDVIRALIETNGNKAAASRKLGISKSVVTYHTKNIRNLPVARLGKYARELKITVAEIKRLCADLNPAKGITLIDIIRELLASRGNRAIAARRLGIVSSHISHCVKNIRRLPVSELRKYADELNTTVDKIKRVCANFDSRKGITHIDVIRELLASRGNRKIAARNLGIADNVVSIHAKNIRRMPDIELQKYAEKLNTAVDEIKLACADFSSTKGITHIDVIRELIACGGNRTEAARRLRTVDGSVSRHAQNIRRLPDTRLQKYAAKLNTTVDEIRIVCADSDIRKGITHIDIIRALLTSGGNRKAAAQNLRISAGVVSWYARNIIQMPDIELQKYALKLSKELRTRIKLSDIRNVAAPRRIKKINLERRIQIIRELLACGGNRAAAARNLGITDNVVSTHAKNIRRVPDIELQEYADKLNTTTDEIKRVCADLTCAKDITHIDIIRELLSCGGNRHAAAKNLGITPQVISRHTKNIMRLPEADIAQYAAELGVSVERINQVCAPRLEKAKKLFKK